MSNALEHISYRWSGIGSGHSNLKHNENMLQEEHPHINIYGQDRKPLREGQIIPPRGGPTTGATLEVKVTTH